ncbi:hypothetical protein J2W40_002500 [Sphingobium xenophagum]|uniref:Polysaccharide lyase n=1 Tax=Sphingobium xenophagum TaxID=121428 RepID=A0ABU1X293_SPHXE|nr:hypothetical protein [Sphingobium xenophagum]MDR7155668.1 hypothetical protein [Sphingobium xenophagum]
MATHMRRCLMVAGVACSVPAIGSSGPTTRLKVDFDQGQAMRAKGSTVIDDARNGVDFRATMDQDTRADTRGTNLPQIVATGCKSPPSCLRVSLDPSRKGAQKNKIMYSFWSHYRPLPGGENGRMRVGDGKTTKISFNMKLGPEYDTPLSQMLHFQVYQSNKMDGGAKPGVTEPGGPIVSLRIVPASRRRNKSPDVEEFIVAVRSPEAGRLIHFDERDKGVLYRGEVRKGTWNNFALVLESGRSNKRIGGRVGFWLNGRKCFDKSVAWGFNPAIYPSNPNLGVELGSYRSADAKGHQTVYFDDVTIDR